MKSSSISLLHMPSPEYAASSKSTAGVATQQWGEQAEGAQTAPSHGGTASQALPNGHASHAAFDDPARAPKRSGKDAAPTGSVARAQSGGSHGDMTPAPAQHAEQQSHQHGAAAQQVADGYLINLIDSPGHVDFCSEVRGCNSTKRIGAGLCCLLSMLETRCCQSCA